jgi:hypothetical protein
LLPYLNAYSVAGPLKKGGNLKIRREFPIPFSVGMRGELIGAVRCRAD